jgi:hypothetical protein
MIRRAGGERARLIHGRDFDFYMNLILQDIDILFYI